MELFALTKEGQWRSASLRQDTLTGLTRLSPDAATRFVVRQCVSEGALVAELPRQPDRFVSLALALLERPTPGVGWDVPHNRRELFDTVEGLDLQRTWVLDDAPDERAEASMAPPLWEPFAGAEAGLRARLRTAPQSTVAASWVVPSPTPGVDTAACWTAAAHDPDAFELGVIGVRLGARVADLPWRDLDQLARSVLERLTGPARPLLELLLTHGRAMSRAFLAAVLDTPAARSLRDTAGTLHDLGLLQDFGDLLRPLSLGSALDDATRTRWTSFLADRCKALANTGVGVLRPTAIVEAHRHLAALPDRRREALEFADFGAQALLETAQALSSDRRFEEAAVLYDDVAALARAQSGQEHAQRLLAYALHYQTYNRARAQTLPRARVVSGYRRAAVLWPDNGLFWQRLLLQMPFDKDGRLDDIGGTRASIREAWASVPDPYRTEYVYDRLIQRLLDRDRRDVLLPLFVDDEVGEARVQPLRLNTFWKQHRDESESIHGHVPSARVRRLWLPGELRVGFLSELRLDLTDLEPLGRHPRWTATLRAATAPSPRSSTSADGPTPFAAYRALCTAVVEDIERALCETHPSRSIPPLDEVWMCEGAAVSQWLVALDRVRGLANATAPALGRLRESILRQQRDLRPVAHAPWQRPELRYDTKEDAVRLRWLGPDGTDGALEMEWTGNGPTHTRWVRPEGSDSMPPLAGAVGRWLDAVRSDEETTSEPAAEPLPEALRAFLATLPLTARVYRAPANHAGLVDLHDKPIALEGERAAVLFVDLHPGFGWSHPCQYVRMGPEGILSVQARAWPPRGWETWLPIER